MKPLDGIKVVSLAINAPGPVAAARLRDFGATVVKVEPPSGDPLEHLGTGWHQDLTQGMEIVTLDLKSPEGVAELETHLSDADLMLTANRPSALDRLGLGWDALHAKFPRLCHVAIVGYLPPNEDVAGHDLNYQAANGMLNPPAMPRVLIADMAGAERATQVALALLLGRERGQDARRELVALSDAAREFATTIRYDITTPGSVLGGGLPNYRIYETSDGYLACGALEMHFFHRLLAAFERDMMDEAELQEVFLTRSAQEWEDWGHARDIPLAKVHGTP